MVKPSLKIFIIIITSAIANSDLAETFPKIMWVYW